MQEIAGIALTGTLVKNTDENNDLDIAVTVLISTTGVRADYVWILDPGDPVDTRQRVPAWRNSKQQPGDIKLTLFPGGPGKPTSSCTLAQLLAKLKASRSSLGATGMYTAAWETKVESSTMSYLKSLSVTKVNDTDRALLAWLKANNVNVEEDGEDADREEPLQPPGEIEFDFDGPDIYRSIYHVPFCRALAKSHEPRLPWDAAFNLDTWRKDGGVKMARADEDDPNAMHFAGVSFLWLFCCL